MDHGEGSQPEGHKSIFRVSRNKASKVSKEENKYQTLGDFYVTYIISTLILSICLARFSILATDGVRLRAQNVVKIWTYDCFFNFDTFLDL